MKHLKLYEDFNWDFDEDEIPDSAIEPGDTIKIGKVYYWDGNYWVSTIFYNEKEIDKVSNSNDVTDNPYNESDFNPIPDKDITLFSIKGHYPWFRYDDNILNEDFDWDFDDEEEEFISDDEFKIIRFKFNDFYCYDHNRYWLYNTNNSKVIRSIEPEITYSSEIKIGGNIKDIMPKDVEKIKDGTIWITNNSPDEIDSFRKWKYSELKDKFHIINL